MNPLIECCEQNLAKGAAALLEDSFIQQNADVVTYSCMNECVLCAQTYYVLFEGERISDQSTEHLTEKVKQAIIDWHKEMN
ncbi:DUF1450 domain-containing protein [Enterococcus sp. BWB1-3]|uniref:DUF1450 domain-containing protein n=1 Tax=unclassified Enterococcus TaxID=2608891 RepID=UPI00192288E1|nr:MULTISPECIES: DUF1450 domain-containing protein [unclassified Enterococcus]MBL1228951.1 DUF1450 domain-containing protein [Enterococcus sp. BWB1-3]MCB5951505.1 YuzB family protein [Enterococcus sp. BWT-B8]MCB5956421.1 YuzB family protein [Enterococcus sp. CWB-B31]